MSRDRPSPSDHLTRPSIAVAVAGTAAFAAVLTLLGMVLFDRPPGAAAASGCAFALITGVLWYAMGRRDRRT